MPNARNFTRSSYQPVVPSESIGEIESYLHRLWPLGRSITGDAVRETHNILGELIPLQRLEIASGTRCFDWTVPNEWNVREAYVVTPDGERILDFRSHTLHLVSYSIPFKGEMTLAELDAHLYSLPDQPTAIPYVTSYYEPRWGFCLSHEQRLALRDGIYEVVVDTSLEPGSMTLSEAVLPGRTSEEVLISTYTCHPSMANNELSGPLVAAFLYRRLLAVPNRRLTYRFAFLPETIGSIAYLSLRSEDLMKNLVAGYVATCAGDPAPFTYKRSRRGNSIADRAAEYVLRKHTESPLIIDFRPRGSDERQYCSPGFNLPVGVIARSIFFAYSEYHTSLDNLDFVEPEAISGSVDAYLAACLLMDQNLVYNRTSPYCEPNLGSNGLYPTVGGRKKGDLIDAMMWVLNLSDGEHDLLSIAERSNCDFWLLARAAELCAEKDILRLSTRPPSQNGLGDNSVN